MNERNFNYQNNDSKAYYGVDGEGRLFRKPTELELDKGGKDIVPHTFTKGEKSGQTVMRKVTQAIYGIVTSFWVKSSDFGDSLIVELFEKGFTSILQVPIDSTFADSIIRKINNVEAGKVYEFMPYKIQAKDMNTGVLLKDKNGLPKFNRGFSIKDGLGNKVDTFITKEKQEQLIPYSTCPLFKKDLEIKSQSSDFWKMYFALVLNAFKDRVIPSNKLRFQTWATLNLAQLEMQEPEPIYENMTVETTSQGIKLSDLNSPDSFPIIEPPINYENGAPVTDDLPF